MPRLALLLATAAFACAPAVADVPEEFRIDREEVFEFAAKPTVARDGDRLTIAFETRAMCDVTVAIEQPDGRIVRHLASGVLGDNAPPPLAKGTKKQVLTWDGKNDQGRYVQDPERLRVRVSLGLAPRFERTLYYSPQKRYGSESPIVEARPEGVYVYEGRGVDHVRLFDHEGNFVREIYPFPRNELNDVRGLRWHDYPQGWRLPLKHSKDQQTLLTSGSNSEGSGKAGRAASVLAVSADGRLALAEQRLNRLATDGSTGGLPLDGPNVSFEVPLRGMNASGTGTVTPTAAAFSPDGKYLYLAGYAWRFSWHFDSLHGVLRVPFDGSGPPETFVGSLKQDDAGAKPGQFRCATGVAVDATGRVYVGDFMNDRVQVFDASGKFLKAIAVKRPAQLAIHHKTQELYVFSYIVPNRILAKSSMPEKDKCIQPTMYRLGAFDDPKPIATYPLPLEEYKGRNNEWGSWAQIRGPLYWCELDSWTDPPTVWLGQIQNQRGANQYSGIAGQRWSRSAVRLLQVRDGKLEQVRDFGQDVNQQVVRSAPPIWNTQRMYANPANGKLYIGEYDSGPASKTFTYFVEIDPGTGEQRLVELPYSAEDAAFDGDGLVYLRNSGAVGRFQLANWREVPWDYGEEIEGVGSSSMYGKSASLKGGLVLPDQSPVCYHQGGMALSPAGHLAVSCALRYVPEGRKEAETIHHGKKYSPKLYPGRIFNSTSPTVHIWNRHGELVVEDAVPGLMMIDGIGLDNQDNVYVMSTATRMLGEKAYFDKMTGTMMKLAPKHAKIISSSRSVPVPVGASRPKRPADLSGFWVDGAEWFFGGVGYAGFNAPAPSCACWHARFSLDSFARSFAPEPQQFRVAVLDSAGNLILQIGKYGNIQDGKPLIENPLVPGTRPIGGDEVSLFHASYVATDTDRRVFIADFGTGRVLGVKLDYHATETVDIKGK